MEEHEAYARAKERVEEIKGFYIHLMVYIVVNGFLVAINYMTFWGYKWFIWPLLGWGIGLLIHFAATFIFEGFLGHDWEDRKIKQIMEKKKRQG